MVKFLCDNCGHKLKASPDLAGQRCKCSRCGRALTVPSSPSGTSPDKERRVPRSPDKQAGPSPPSGPVNKKARWRLALGLSIAAGLLAVAGLVVFLVCSRDVDRNLTDLKSGTPEARRQALLWLAQADVEVPTAPR